MVGWLCLSAQRFQRNSVWPKLNIAQKTIIQHTVVQSPGSTSTTANCRDEKRGQWWEASTAGHVSPPWSALCKTTSRARMQLWESWWLTWRLDFHRKKAQAASASSVMGSTEGHAGYHFPRSKNCSSPLQQACSVVSCFLACPGLLAKFITFIDLLI